MIGLCAMAIALSACEGVVIEEVGEIQYGNQQARYGESTDSSGIFDGMGLPFVGNNEAGTSTASGGGIGVNSYLWRASLDTVSFMPLASADPFGGVIITDWYSPPETREERFKMTVYILDRQLRADGIKVSVFRQEMASGNQWQDTTIGTSTATQLEDAILTRARQLRSEVMPK